MTKSIWHWCLATMVSAGSAAAQSPPPADSFRYIVHWDGVPIRCDTSDTATFPLPYLRHRDGWYGAQLRATGQGPLCAGSATLTSVFRLTWIPSFYPTVMIRIEQHGATYSLYAVRLTGAGGYAPGSKGRDTTVTLASSDWEEWLRLLSAARFWEASTGESDSVVSPHGKAFAIMGADGAQWLLEGRRGNQYHAVDRWSPHAEPNLPFRKACEWLLKRSGMVDSVVVADY